MNAHLSSLNYDGLLIVKNFFLIAKTNNDKIEYIEYLIANNPLTSKHYRAVVTDNNILEFLSVIKESPNAELNFSLIRSDGVHVPCVMKLKFTPFVTLKPYYTFDFDLQL